MLNSFGEQTTTGDRMIFITLMRFREKPTKELIKEAQKLEAKFVEEGGVVVVSFWTLGRYDAVIITEAEDEKSAMTNALRWGDIASTETLVALPMEEAIKLLG